MLYPDHQLQIHEQYISIFQPARSDRMERPCPTLGKSMESIC